MNEQDREALEEDKAGPVGSEAAEEEDLAQETWDRTDYPLRDGSEDPRWAVRTVWIWIGLALASLIFIIVMAILGAIYD